MYNDVSLIMKTRSNYTLKVLLFLSYGGICVTACRTISGCLVFAVEKNWTTSSAVSDAYTLSLSDSVYASVKTDNNFRSKQSDIEVQITVDD